METFESRLKAERQELADRMSKLDAFIGSEKFTSLATIHRSLLQIQLNAMKTYHSVLTERMALLGLLE